MKAFDEFASVAVVTILLVYGAIFAKITIIPLGYEKVERIRLLGEKHQDYSSMSDMAIESFSQFLGIADAMSTAVLFACILLVTPICRSFKRGKTEFRGKDI